MFKLLTPRETGRALGVSVHTLANWRAAGRGPAFLRIGRGRVRYREVDLSAFVAGHLVHPRVVGAAAGTA